MSVGRAQPWSNSTWLRPQALGTAELVTLLAGFVALNALAMDIMLPALADIARDLRLQNPALRQQVVVGFLFGTGVGQLFAGPLSDRYGRKPVLYASLGLYSVLGLLCTLATSFPMLVFLRIAQGFASAGARNASTAVVRDQFEGTAMARIMSYVLTVFMIVPILAPSVGAFILVIGQWRAIFWCIALFGLVLMVWSMRLPETLKPELRRPIDVRSILSSYREVLSNPITLGYTVALGMMFASLIAYVGSSELVFEHYGLKASFPYFFALSALAMAGGNYLNASLVTRFGPRRVGQSSLLGFLCIKTTYLGLVAFGFSQFGYYYAFTGLTFVSLSWAGANFNALALEPMGKLAGTASAVNGFASTSLSAGLGGLVGSFYVDSPWPFAVGDVAFGLVALLAVLYSEGGRLFVGR